MLLLVGWSVSLAAPVVSSLASRFPVAHGSDTRHLFVVACLHLQPVWEGRGLAGAPHVVGGSKPDVNDVVRLVAVLVDHLVDGGVPVQRLVLLHIPGVARGAPQISIRDLWSHRLVRSCPVKPERVKFYIENKQVNICLLSLTYEHGLTSIPLSARTSRDLSERFRRRENPS